MTGSLKSLPSHLLSKITLFLKKSFSQNGEAENNVLFMMWSETSVEYNEILLLTFYQRRLQLY